MQQSSANVPPKKSTKRPFHFRIFLQQLVSFIIWVIVVLITLRILLHLLGANTDAPFAEFILSLSDPLTQPFYGLFNNRPVGGGTSFFDTSSMVAIIVYLLVGLGIHKLLSVTHT